MSAMPISRTSLSSKKLRSMKYIIILLFLFIFSLLKLFAQSRPVPVFVSGTEGYKSYRIPAIIILPHGNLLAFAEGRVHGAGDFGDIDIVMKRSTNRAKHGPLFKPLLMWILYKPVIVHQ